MAKCKFCGESNPDGSRFCAHCGQALVQDDNAAVAAALEAAREEFDKDALVTLDKSRITYVCTVCGSINRIDQEKCTRCGKPRPRSEYVGALRRIKQSERAKEEAATLTAPLPVAVPEIQKPEPAEKAEAPVQEAPKQAAAPVAAQAAPQVVSAYGGQANAIAQPFIVVPYVNPMQPIWQYQTNQLYRYQEYTPEELEAMKARREMEELNARMSLVAQEKAREAQLAQERERMEAMSAAPDAAPAGLRAQDVKPVKSRSTGVTVVAVIALFLTLGLLALSYLLPFAAGNKAYHYLLGIVPVLASFMPFDAPASIGYVYSGPLDMIAPIGATVMAICALVIIIRCFVRIGTGRARHRGGFMGTLMLCGYIALLVGLVFNIYETLNMDTVRSLFTESAEIGLWMILALVAVIFIVCWCSPKTYRKPKKNK